MKANEDLTLLETVENTVSQALKQFYERNARLAPRVPSGTSPEFTHLLHHLLKRDAKDRISFEDFISHPFLAPPTPPVHQKEATAAKTGVAKAVPERARIEGKVWEHSFLSSNIQQ